jgi:hypothetical protein
MTPQEWFDTARLVRSIDDGNVAYESLDSVHKARVDEARALNGKLAQAKAEHCKVLAESSTKLRELADSAERERRATGKYLLYSLLRVGAGVGLVWFALRHDLGWGSGAVNGATEDMPVASSWIAIGGILFVWGVRNFCRWMKSL